MAEKYSEESMSSLAWEMRQAISVIAGPRGWTDTREAWLARAARRAGITYRQAKALFYQEIDDPRASVVERVRAAALVQGRTEAADLAGRFETIAGALNAQDADFYSADVAALLDAARALRGLDRSRDKQRQQS